MLSKGLGLYFLSWLRLLQFQVTEIFQSARDKCLVLSQEGKVSSAPGTSGCGWEKVARAVSCGLCLQLLSGSPHGVRISTSNPGFTSRLLAPVDLHDLWRESPPEEYHSPSLDDLLIPEPVTVVGAWVALNGLT